MNVPNNSNVQENAYDNISVLWVVSRRITGWCNKNKTSTVMHYDGQYYSTSFLLKIILDISGNLL